MAGFPMYIELDGAVCLIIGGGKVAFRKAHTLLGLGAEVYMLSMTFQPDEIKAKKQLHLFTVDQEETFKVLQKGITSENSHKIRLMVCASDDRVLNHKIAEFAKFNRILVNSATSVEDCDFYFPSVIQRGNLTVGVSSSGQAPALTRFVARQIQAVLPEWYEDLENVGDMARPMIKEAVEDSNVRRKIFYKVLRAALEAEGKLTKEEIRTLIGSKKEMKWLVIGGTSESIECVKYLVSKKVLTVVSAATEMGADLYKEYPVEIWQGRLDRQGFEKKIMEAHITHVLDASHPYAVEVTKLIRSIADQYALSYYRFTRRDADYPEYEKLHWAADMEQAAALAAGLDGAILLTTGVQTLANYKEHIPDFQERCFARVLANDRSIQVCREIFKDASHWMAEDPPFDVEDNRQLIRKVHAGVVITKDSGRAGGVFEKLEACRMEAIDLILIERPVEKDILLSLDRLDPLFKKAGEN